MEGGSRGPVLCWSLPLHLQLLHSCHPSVLAQMCLDLALGCMPDIFNCYPALFTYCVLGASEQFLRRHAGQTHLTQKTTKLSQSLGDRTGEWLGNANSKPPAGSADSPRPWPGTQRQSQPTPASLYNPQTQPAAARSY
jgi:hypothetical protein